jgi:hypothetical protein
MLLWADGFENYGTSGTPTPSGVMSRKYTTNLDGTYGISTGRFGGYCFYMTWDSGVYIQTPALTTDATIVVGLAIKFPEYYNYNYQFLSLLDGATWGVNFWITPVGEIEIYRGGTLLGTTNGANIRQTKWYYIEIKVKCDDSTGTYEVRVGGVTVGSGSGLDTKAGSNAYHDRVRIVCGARNHTYYDDFYVCDTSGSLNNDFLGNVKVVTMRPDSAGDTTEFTPSAGSNYACVDEAVANDDTDYVSDATTDHKDLYNYGASTLNSIKGVVVCTDCRQSDATAFSLKTPCKSGATENDDSAQSIGTTSYVTKQRVLETDPNTSTTWTLTDLNAAQFGVKVG